MSELESDPNDRRSRRSDDPITALHYQLAFTRQLAGLDAVVLVDESGCLVAGAGAWPTCEELAAYAPLLAHPAEVKSRVVGSRIAEMSRDIAVQAIDVLGGEALLCGRGGKGDRSALLLRAAEGCRRILGPS